MRQYTVRAGDSPARIAAEYAGCPKCARDLIGANRHKKAVSYPNGYTTFEALAAGETLNLPDKWFSKAFDELPKAYFAALPYADGRTPSTLGDQAAGVLGSFAELDDASARVGHLAVLGDREFHAEANGTADAIDRSILGTNSTDATVARSATSIARGKNAALGAAIAGGATSSTDLRNAILSNLSDGLVAARKALNATSIPVSTGPSPASAAVAALTAIDPCSPANAAAVCAAQRALGVTADGKYGDGTAIAARAAVPGAPAGCSPRPSWWKQASQSNCPGAPSSSSPPALSPPASESSKGISAAGIMGLGLLSVGTVGGAIYLTTRAGSKKTRKRRR